MTSQATSELKELVITREFDAPRERVWKAWTDPEMVKRWWGPEGFTAPSIMIDLRVGGRYIFAMQGPPGSELEAVGYNAGVYKEVRAPASTSSTRSSPRRNPATSQVGSQ